MGGLTIRLVLRPACLCTRFSISASSCRCRAASLCAACKLNSFQHRRGRLVHCPLPDQLLPTLFFFPHTTPAASQSSQGSHSHRYLTSNSPQLPLLIPISVLLALSRKPGHRPSASAAPASPPRPPSSPVCPEELSFPSKAQRPSTVMLLSYSMPLWSCAKLG